MPKNTMFSSSKTDLQQSLDELNRQMQERETQARAGALGLPYIDLHNFPIDLNVLGMFTEEEAKEMGAVPFYKEQTDLRIGITDPDHPLLLEKLREFSQHNKLTVYVISHKSLEQVLRFYAKVMRPKAAHDDVVRVEKTEDYHELFKILASEEEQKKHTATDLVEIIFGASLFYKSSDIHIEPEEHFVKVRFRVDGVLQDILHLSKTLQKSFITRLKIISKLKLNVENEAQDGRITFYYLGKPIDVRVSVLPSAYGEEVVMRLLGTGAVNLKLKDLGFRPEHQEILHRV
ncbi:MAG: Flp pilus assembly complex ATPase component TadA, partial [Patescibacteria group bacterium]|nr:Flp pilus assembly complex ATPase component TadA [Patescibacteria group bacterium]